MEYLGYIMKKRPIKALILIAVLIVIALIVAEDLFSQ